MSNKLEKSINITYLPGSPGTPASPGHPATPAYYTSEDVTVCSNVPVLPLPPGYHYQFTDGGYIIIGPGGVKASGINIPSQVHKCAIQKQYTYHPPTSYVAPHGEIPGVPSQVLYDFNIGWNSGARSIHSFTGNGYIEFKVPMSAIGVVVGLNERDIGWGYSEINYAWYISSGVAKIFENGVQVASPGTITPGAVLSIRRVDGAVEYLINGSLSYSSGVPSAGRVFMDTSLYSGGDYIYDPVISGLDEAGNTFREMSGICGDVASYAYSANSFRPMIGESVPFYGAATSFLAMSGISGDHPYAAVEASFAPMTGEASALVVPSYAISANQFMALSLQTMDSRRGVNGRVGFAADVGFEPLDGLSSDHPYGEARGSFPAMFGGGATVDGAGEASMYEGMFITDTLTLDISIFVSFTTTVTDESEWEAGIVMPAEMSVIVTATAGMTANDILQALMNSVIQAGFSVPFFGEASTVWVVNADTKGSTRYDNYGFNSYVKLGDKYYGAMPGGLYELEGADDAGDPVRAMISMGKRDFFSPKLKRMSNAYIGVSSTGRMFLKVIANGKAYTYAARNFSEDLSTRRFDLGKGARANFFEFELYNSDGADFELSTVEFMAATIDRRI